MYKIICNKPGMILQKKSLPGFSLSQIYPVLIRNFSPFFVVINTSPWYPKIKKESDSGMKNKVKLLRLMPGFFFSIFILGLLACIIYPDVFTSMAYFIVPIMVSLAFRSFILKKYPENSHDRRVFTISILVPALLGVITIFGFFIWRQIM